MARDTLIGLGKAAAMLVVASAVAVRISNYTHPNLHGASTDALRREVMRLGRDHAGSMSPFVGQVFERQERIVAELVRRNPTVIAELKTAEQSERLSRVNASVVMDDGDER